MWTGVLMRVGEAVWTGGCRTSYIYLYRTFWMRTERGGGGVGVAGPLELRSKRAGRDRTRGWGGKDGRQTAERDGR
jgi:hypothetical protein